MGSTGSSGWAVAVKVAIGLAMALLLGWGVLNFRDGQRLHRGAGTMRGVVAEDTGLGGIDRRRDATGEAGAQRERRKNFIGGLDGVRFRRSFAGVAPSGASALGGAEVEPDTAAYSAAMTNRLSSGQTLVVGGWSGEGMRGYLVVSPVAVPPPGASDQGTVVLRSRVIRAPEASWENIGWGQARSDTRRSSLSVILDASQEAELLDWLGGVADAEISNESVATNAYGRPIGFAFSVDEESGERGGVLVAIDLVPRPATEGGALDLELQPGPMEADLLHTSLRREGDAAAIPTP